ncbi:MAG: alpha/beta fold hydrolase, partial [Planctomycetota bacterium]|nr:alpha/beta fold hydrolase [Planctomycetota bacterium]
MVASCTEAQTEQSPRVEDVEMTARCDGTPQRYLLVFPPKFQNHRETDLLFVLHGHGSDRWQAVRNAPAEFQAARDVAAARGILLVSPDYRARTSWMGPKAEADMLQILEELKARYKIRKVILLGASMGGSSVLTFAALHPRLVDGVVSENGTANHIEYDQFQDAIRESFGGTKEQIPDEYKKRSAELWPERLSMPVAITAGGQDKLV